MSAGAFASLPPWLRWVIIAVGVFVVVVVVVVGRAIPGRDGE